MEESVRKANAPMRLIVLIILLSEYIWLIPYLVDFLRLYGLKEGGSPDVKRPRFIKTCLIAHLDEPLALMSIVKSAALAKRVIECFDHVEQLKIP